MGLQYTQTNDIEIAYNNNSFYLTHSDSGGQKQKAELTG